MTEPEVEFFDPAIRSELERRDAEVIKKNGKQKGGEMVWLTSYSRIPVSLVENKHFISFLLLAVLAVCVEVCVNSPEN
jgi:hypothetical protein